MWFQVVLACASLRQIVFLLYCRHEKSQILISKINYVIVFKNIMYKRREEAHLSEKILSSKLISKEELEYIKNLYCEFVPYHNFIHALKVSESVLMLPLSDFSIVEIRSLLIAALFHDAGHRGTASDLDEFRSLDMAFEGILDFEKRYDYE